MQYFFINILLFSVEKAIQKSNPEKQLGSSAAMQLGSLTKRFQKEFIRFSIYFPGTGKMKIRKKAYFIKVIKYFKKL